MPVALLWAETPKPLETVNSDLPDMASIDDVATKKQVFFEFLNPIIQRVNQRIVAERIWLLQMQTDLVQGEEAEPWQASYLAQLGHEYEVEETPGSEAYFDQMLNRVDVIPASLVLAQAANESAWGTSRFALEGNNLLGQWCFAEGCGLVPAGRPEGERYEVKVFSDVAESVAAYFQNVNTHPPYRDLRNIRSELRYLGEPASALMLVWGLEGYSIRGEEYIRELTEMITHNELTEYDQRPFYAAN
ncbi:glucosaminidase domain-containing protein [Saccharospirillum impatiens]|uniref:glucosaminidase domain-containing protein n=1 Tax=Saccharospirillum impatiens TaxID=169438 RepID=UPI000401BADC|nr:glucosaminidase domain-containing protein [Saccharospirillum impatiens]